MFEKYPTAEIPKEEFNDMLANAIALSYIFERGVQLAKKREEEELTDQHKVRFDKEEWHCKGCGHIWVEFLPLKCPNCDALFGIKKVKLQ